jgi:type VI secretion system secreted protein VgrG
VDAGVFWGVGSSATLGTSTSFAGNILAKASITLDNGATMGCGGAFANTGAVTMDNNTVSSGCIGGLDVAGLGEVATALPFASVPTIPEPDTYAIMLSGLGLLGFDVRRRNQKAA